jgi:hypothetical protein
MATVVPDIESEGVRRLMLKGEPLDEEKGGEPSPLQEEHRRTCMLAPLYELAEMGDQKHLAFALDTGRTVQEEEERDEDGATALHWAAQRGHIEVRSSVSLSLLSVDLTCADSRHAFGTFSCHC